MSTVFLLGWGVWVMFWAPPAGGATLIIHSKIVRPNLGFNVNGVVGGNASAHNPNNKYSNESGGSTTCCGSIKGKTAEVIWSVTYTRAQYNAGLRTEVHKVIMPLPERKRGENDLHVYFFYREIRCYWGGAIMRSPPMIRAARMIRRQ